MNGRMHKDYRETNATIWWIFAIFLMACFLIMLAVFYIPLMSAVNCHWFASPKAIADGRVYCNSKSLNLIDVTWNGAECVWRCG
jgi:hypothetical protein